MKNMKIIEVTYDILILNRPFINLGSIKIGLIQKIYFMVSDHHFQSESCQRTFFLQSFTHLEKKLIVEQQNKH